MTSSSAGAYAAHAMVGRGESRPKILLVEDDINLGRAMTALLDILGFDVIGPAHSSDEALGFLGNASVDAAILDVNLGEENSFPVAEALEDHGCPFLFVTGYSDGEETQRWAQVAVLSKPVFKADLQRELEKLLGTVAAA